MKSWKFVPNLTGAGLLAFLVSPFSLLASFNFSILQSSIVHAEASGTVKIDPKASVVKWTGKKVTGSHYGTVQIKDGSAELKDGKLTGGEFEIDMNSIKVDDITDPTDNAKLANHLKSDDFFSSAKFPTVTFKIKETSPITPASPSDPNTKIKGDLTITGITHPLEFPARVTVSEGKAVAVASIEVDRTLWNIRYGSGKFFQSLGDKIIYDNFTVDLNLVGNV